MKAQGKVASKDSKGEGEGETVSGRRTEGEGEVGKGVFFFIPPKTPGPIFLITSPKKREPLFRQFIIT